MISSDSPGDTTSCVACLSRSALIAEVSGNIETLDPRRARARKLLSLPDRELIEAVGGDPNYQLHSARRNAEQFAVLANRAAGVETCCAHSEWFPGGLEELDDCPATIHVLPDVDRLRGLLGRRTVAIVGARRASVYGRTVAYELGRGLAAAGVTVASGMAMGIDAAAHQGALDGGGTTVAILAGGVELPTPRVNSALYRSIIAHGAVISEFPVGARPMKWSFPARNRLIAAVAELTVVVEATRASGSRHTADFARQIGRDVAAVPGQVNADLASGPNDLLFDGAYMVRDAGDILDLLFGVGNWADQNQAVSVPSHLRFVYDQVKIETQTVEGILAQVRGAEPSSVSAALGELELLGLVERLPGGAYGVCRLSSHRAAV